MIRQNIFLIGFSFLFWLLQGCDKAIISVEPDDADNKMFFITYTSDSTSAANPYTSPKFLEDSLLSLTYKIYYDVTGDTGQYSPFTIEYFRIILRQKTVQDDSINYGVLNYAGTKLIRQDFIPNKDIYYFYLSLKAGESDSSSAPWNKHFNLEEQQILSSSNSDLYSGVNTTLSTIKPVKIVNIHSGTTLDANSDLEIKFSRELKQGSTISLGYYDSFVKFELNQTTDLIVIPKENLLHLTGSFLPQYKGRCYISVSEGFQIGSLSTIIPANGHKYSIPIYQFSSERTTVFLINKRS